MNKSFEKSRGYAAGAERDCVTAEGILRLLPISLKRRYFPCVEVWDRIGSTNDRAARIAEDRRKACGEVFPTELSDSPETALYHGESSAEDIGLYIIVAREQSAGRGTRGRSFYSPRGGGIYMSLLFFPEKPVPSIPPITAAAAVSVCETLERLYEARGIDSKVGIKWVNDIFLCGRKICGILTEGSVSDGVMYSAALGIGLNLTEPEGGFPEELRGVAGAAFEREAPSREEVIAAITEALLGYLEGASPDEIMHRYRERSTLIGRSVSVMLDGTSVECTALDISREGHLIVRTPSGKVRTVISAAELR